MSSNISQNTLELLLKQINVLNKKIENLEIKIDNINNAKIIYIDKKRNITDMNNIDWNSVHLY
jgi:hypothetical protein